MVSCTLCVSASLGMCLRFRLQFVKQSIEALEVPLPELTVTLEPLAGLGEGFGFEAAGPALGVTAPGDETGAFKHLEMLGNGGLAHGEGLGELIDGGFPGGEMGEYGATRGIGQSGEGSVELSITTRLHNQ